MLSRILFFYLFFNPFFISSQEINIEFEKCPLKKLERAYPEYIPHVINKIIKILNTIYNEEIVFSSGNKMTLMESLLQIEGKEDNAVFINHIRHFSLNSLTSITSQVTEQYHSYFKILAQEWLKKRNYSPKDVLLFFLLTKNQNSQTAQKIDAKNLKRSVQLFSLFLKDILLNMPLSTKDCINVRPEEEQIFLKSFLSEK
jgi:hypothetical protein